MPNTTNLALPYPSLTDTPNIPQHIQSLAGAVDTRLGGAWTSFEFTTAGSVGFTQSLVTQQNAYKMLGNKTMAIRVYMTLTNATGINGASPVELGPIPEGASVSFVNTLSGLVWRSTSNFYFLAVNPSGVRFTALYHSAGARVTGTSPYNPWAVGDVIRFEGTVELQ